MTYPLSKVTKAGSSETFESNRNNTGGNIIGINSIVVLKSVDTIVPPQFQQHLRNKGLSNDIINFFASMQHTISGKVNVSEMKFNQTANSLDIVAVAVYSNGSYLKVVLLKKIYVVTFTAPEIMIKAVTKHHKTGYHYSVYQSISVSRQLNNAELNKIQQTLDSETGYRKLQKMAEQILIDYVNSNPQKPYNSFQLKSAHQNLFDSSSMIYPLPAYYGQSSLGQQDRQIYQKDIEDLQLMVVDVERKLEPIKEESQLEDGQLIHLYSKQDSFNNFGERSSHRLQNASFEQSVFGIQFPSDKKQHLGGYSDLQREVAENGRVSVSYLQAMKSEESCQLSKLLAPNIQRQLQSNQKGIYEQLFANKHLQKLSNEQRSGSMQDLLVSDEELRSQATLQKINQSSGFSFFNSKVVKKQIVVQSEFLQSILEELLQSLSNILTPKLIQATKDYLKIIMDANARMGNLNRHQIHFQKNKDTNPCFIKAFFKRNAKYVYLYFNIIKNTFRLAPDIYLAHENESKYYLCGLCSSNTQREVIKEINRGFRKEDLALLLKTHQNQEIDSFILKEFNAAE